MTYDNQYVLFKELEWRAERPAAAERYRRAWLESRDPSPWRALLWQGGQAVIWIGVRLQAWGQDERRGRAPA